MDLCPVIGELSLRLLFIGNVIPRKGLHTLLDALARLPKGSVQLDIVGSLTTDPNLRSGICKIEPAKSIIHPSAFMAR